LAPDATRSDYGTGEWYLHDGVTGERRAGPIHGVSVVGPAPFSPDGRWFVGIHGPALGGIEGIRGRDIFSTDTGELVLGLPDHAGLLAVGCFFAPDGETVAVDWIPDNRKEESEHVIEVFELPSGKLRYRFDTPPGPWRRIAKWDGRRLETLVPDGQSCVFDLSLEPVSDRFEDPLRGNARWETDYWEDGPGWIAYYREFSGLPREFQAWKDWLAARIGMRRAWADNYKLRVRIVDRATGATRSVMSFPFLWSYKLSRDARWLAHATDDDGVEVWDTGPPVRWPLALAAGAVAAGGVLGIGKGRHRSKRDKGRPVV
jgi:hypothetical protein